MLQYADMSAVYKRLFFLTAYAAAMGFVEAAVVVYLRQLYYPAGFYFPLTTAVLQYLWIEYFREAATIVMLWSLAALAGRGRIDKFAVFLFSFGLWDLFYYLWLKLMLDWPTSFFTWDVLFLIPVVWVAPVLAPVICAATMIAIALALLGVQQTRGALVLKKTESALFTVGCLIIFFTFIADYTTLLFRTGFTAGFINPAENPQVLAAISQYVPSSYQWGLFTLGEFALIGSMLLLLRKNAHDI